MEKYGYQATTKIHVFKHKIPAQVSGLSNKRQTQLSDLSIKWHTEVILEGIIFPFSVWNHDFYSIWFGKKLRHLTNRFTFDDWENIENAGKAKAFIFSSTSTLEITGSKSGRSLTARILGPCRDYSQVELAYTDALTIGVDAPGTFFLSPFGLLEKENA